MASSKGKPKVGKPAEAYEADLSAFLPDDKNANKHTARGMSQLETSLRQFGAGRSIVVDKNGRLIGGGATQEVAIDLGMTDAIVVPSDGKKLVVVQRTDLDLDSPQGRGLALADNRVAQTNLDFDGGMIRLYADAGVDMEPWFYDSELEIVYGEESKQGGEGDPGAAKDKAEQWMAKWGVGPGQLWLLGHHRLLCGDAYSEADRARLIGGVAIDLLHTDPPYGIQAVKESNVKGTGETSGRKNKEPGFARSGDSARPVTDQAFRTGAMRRTSRTALVVQPNVYPVMKGDERAFDPTAFLAVAPKAVLWGANNYATALPISRAWITWDKREDITRNDFSDCELAWTNADTVSRCFHHLWNGLHKGSQNGERRLHPTEKPVALFAEIGRRYADGGVWLDLFAGSGAQLVAAEQTGATCLACEIEPLYVATIIERMSKMGIAPQLVAQTE